MSETQTKKHLSITGIIVTVAVTAGFLWAAVQWFNRDNYKVIPVSQMQENEIHAFENLRLISQAQKKYKETDWDGDGKKTYAMYFVHLWTSVSAKSEPIPVNLIPRKLAFAMEVDKAIDGFYFIDMHDSISRGARGQAQAPMDYEKQWAVLALPANIGHTGSLNFLADQSGSIYVNSAKYVAPQYPENPAGAGWIKIENVEKLKDFQKGIIYTEEDSQK